MRVTKMSFKLVVATLAIAVLGTSIHASDAENRGLLDSVVSTLAGGNTGDGATNAKTVALTGLSSMGGIAADSSGNIYFPESNRIFKLTIATGVLSVIAGEGTAGYSGENVAATSALLTLNAGTARIALDSSSNVYFVDNGNVSPRIRKITVATGTINTVAGNGTGISLLADIGRVATAARLPLGIIGLAVNAGGDIFFASTSDTFSGVNCIYKVAIADGLLSIVAGDGSTSNQPVDGVTALGNPCGLINGFALLSTGEPIYSTNNGAGQPGGRGAIREITSTGTNVIIAGAVDVASGGTVQLSFNPLVPDDGSKDAKQVGVVAATTGGLMNPRQIAVDGTTIFYYDGTIRRIRSFAIGGKIKTVFGELGENQNNPGFRGDATVATVNTPRTVAGVDDNKRNDDPKARIGNGGLAAVSGKLIFNDTGNNLIRSIDLTANIVTTIAGATLPFRVTNGLPTINTQAISNTTAVAAKGAPILSPTHVVRESSASSNLIFDATDSLLGGLNIYKYDATALTVALVAGRAYTNGFLANVGDGGQATVAELGNVGSQASLLSDNTAFFADSSTHTIRSVSSAGVLSTVAGIPGLSGSIYPEGDSSLVTATGAADTTGITRVGRTATTVLFNAPKGVLATTATNFIVADTGNNKVVVVVAGTITQDITVPFAPSFLALSGASTLFVGGSASNEVSRIDLSLATPVAVSFAAGASISVTATSAVGSAVLTGITSTAGVTIGSTVTVAAGASGVAGFSVVSVTATTITLSANATGVATGVFTFAPAAGVLGNTRALAIGTNGLFIFDASNTVRLASTASLATGNPAILYNFATGLAGTATGMAVSGTVVTLAVSGDTLHRFTDTGVAPLAGALTQIAGQFSNANVNVNGFNLQSNFGFTTNTPLAVFADNTLLVGDEEALQFRRVTIGATAPTSTFAVFAGNGLESLGQILTNAAGSATTVTLASNGLAVDAAGAVYSSDNSKGVVRKISGGTVQTFAGVYGNTTGTTVNGNNRLKATFSDPVGLAFNAAGELHVVDGNTGLVWKVQSDNTMVLVAGSLDNTTGGGAGDQFLPTLARLNEPSAITFSPNGDLYITEVPSSPATHRIRVISNNIITTLVENHAGTGIVLDGAGKVYFNGILSASHNKVFRLSKDVVEGIAGDRDNVSGFNGDGLPGVRTLLSNTGGVAYDATLGLIFTDGGNNRIRAITNLAETTGVAPIALITANQTLGPAPLKVGFDGTGSFDADGDIVSYEWDFGDSTKGYGSVVEKVFTISGSYIVTLTVKDSQGNKSVAKTVVFAAATVVASSTAGKGSFKVSFKPTAAGKTAKASDSFTLTMTNVAGLTDDSGKAVTVTIGSYSVSAVIASKTVKNTSKVLKVVIDTKKKSIAVSIKGVLLKDAFIDLGVKNENSVNGKLGTTVLIPVVIQVTSGAIYGDNFLFNVSTKYNSGASGSFAQ